MKNLNKEFENYIQEQTDLEMGILYFELAKKKFSELVDLEIDQQKIQFQEYIINVKKLLETSEMFLGKTRNPAFLAITNRFKVFVLNIEKKENN